MGHEKRLSYSLQIADNNSAVWVHSSDGSTVGRFGRMGIDLHNTVTEMMAGAPQCRLCTHGMPSLADWQLFREKVREWWGVDVPEDAFDPALLRGGSKTKA
ncbi:TPA: hypothetical protein NHR53_006292 [Pseudomonas aeruginosa]|nr:hypothetical protein [Pseudomonas aeruginosa]HCE8129690.1 hypothetical protein [Pseudomonas aeruginosa]HCF0447839.1 hypothetical protein [Pseudomonas aeruginosa]